MTKILNQKGQAGVETILLMVVGITLIMILRNFIGVEETKDNIKVKYISTQNCNHVRCD